jgi:homoserine O-acetyltransferase
LVCHALSGSALVGSWWPEIFAPGAVLSLDHDFVICINLLGSCYGSTGPGSVDPETGLVYGPDFPLVSIRDNVRAQAHLLDSLGIRRLRLVLGGSIGGMQALDWAMHDPERVERAAIIAVAPLSAMGLALNHLQRQAIQNDPDWDEGYYLPQRPPRRGLALARQIGMLSYKSATLFEERFARNPNRNGENPWSLDNQGGGLTGGRFDIAGYLDHQGERFIERFDANAYLAILRTMDIWDPLNGHSSPKEVFGKIRARLSFVGISSDWLFPARSVEEFASKVRSAGVKADYVEMSSSHGHDAFLAEQGELVRLLQLPV